MPKDPLTDPINAVRRAVDDAAWIRQMLHAAAVGSMASVQDGQPFINSNLFVYNEARKGRRRGLPPPGPGGVEADNGHADQHRKLHW